LSARSNVVRSMTIFCASSAIRRQIACISPGCEAVKKIGTVDFFMSLIIFIRPIKLLVTRARNAMAHTVRERKAATFALFPQIAYECHR
jgi:hypothetical protein